MGLSTWNDVIADALIEIGAFTPFDPIPAAIEQLAIRKLYRIIDQWAARRSYAYTTTFNEYTLTPGVSPNLIGPGLSSPNFAVSSAPVEIVSASLVLTDSTPAVDQPIHVRDNAWWANQRVKSLTTNVPTDLYYERDSPSGSLYFWPVPNYAYSARLETLVEISQMPLDSNGNPDPTQTFVAPQAYESAVVLTLAEDMCTPLGRPMPPELPAKARGARAALLKNNAHSPRIASADFGTRGRTGGGSFNYYTGGPA